MKKAFRLVISLTLVLFFGCQNFDETSPPFLPQSGLVSLDDKPELWTLINGADKKQSNARIADDGLIHTTFGKIDPAYIYELLLTEGQFQPNYTFRLVTPTSSIEEYLIAAWRDDQYYAYILQFEEETTQGSQTEFTGRARVLNLSREVMSNERLVEGVQVESGTNGGRTQEQVCDCRWVFKVTKIVMYSGTSSGGGHVEGYNVLECECVESGGGSEGGNEGPTGVGEPIGGGALGEEGPGNNGSGNPGGGSSDPIGFEGLPKTKEEREAYFELLLETDPFLLLENCDELDEWLALASYTAPTNVANKIQNLHENNEGPLGDWDIQYLDEAGGDIVNLDYWPVRINNMPNKPNGQKYSPEEFLMYFRKNINDFIDNEPFAPYSALGLEAQETELWFSDDPVGAIVKININGFFSDFDGNDGVVVCTQKTYNNWRFMTLEAPGDYSHPVSGTRQFGFKTNSDGSYTFYTRGVDRFTDNLPENIAYGITFGNPFAPADDFWSSLQSGIEKFVEENGGVAESEEVIKNRPDWELIEAILNGTRNASELGCG